MNLWMSTYNYRGHDLYGSPVVSLVVFADDNPKWRPSEYVQKLWGCRTVFRFPTAKILTYRRRWKQLKESDNPFAVVVMSHLKTLETRKNPDNRWKWKIELTKSLYKLGFNKQDILNLFRFIDWIMALPEESDRSFYQEIVRFEEETKMRYVTIAERIGMEKGIVKGKLETAENMLKMGLDKKMICQATGLTEKEIDVLKAKPKKVRQQKS